MDGDREEHRPTGPKGESGLHRLLPESRAEVGLGQHYVAAAQALENYCAAPAAERATRTQSTGSLLSVQMTSSTFYLSAMGQHGGEDRDDPRELTLVRRNLVPFLS